MRAPRLRLAQSPSQVRRHAWVSDFRSQLDDQYRQLRLPAPHVEEALIDEPVDDELMVYFGIDPWDATADPSHAMSLERYAALASELLPVVDRVDHATTHLPSVLQRFNAFVHARVAAAFKEALVDEVLTLIWQRRRRRRIFISYRRDESLQIARQLHDWYSRRSFDVFLDERSIPVGVDFQAGLMRELADCDAVLILVSPKLGASKWVREEIQFANRSRIGLLGVVWPGSLASAGVAQLPVDQQVRLLVEKSAADSLSDVELDEVDKMMFRGRSLVIAARIRDLLDVVESELPAPCAIVAREPNGDMVLDRGGALWRGRVVPFRPTLFEIWQWWREIRFIAGLSGLMVAYPSVQVTSSEEEAFRDVCDAWGRAARPPVEFLRVHL